MVYELLETEESSKLFKKLQPEAQKVFKKRFAKGSQNPYCIGKKLRVYEWFRELKYRNLRVYYLIYDEKIIVLFVGISDKKSQQRVIDNVSSNLQAFKEFVEGEKRVYLVLVDN